MEPTDDRTASLMTPAKLAQVASAPRTPVAPSTFLDRMATDAGHQHVRRLAELRDALDAGARASQATTVVPALQQLAGDLAGLAFDGLQAKGLWAQLTGKGRTTAAAFAARVDDLQEAAQALVAAVAGLHARQQKQAGLSERLLVEVEVEVHALDRIMEQGTRWLHDMRGQLKAREAGAAGDTQALAQIAQDGARCELLVARLKALRAAAAAARQAHEQARVTEARRASLTKAMQQATAGPLQDWRSRTVALAAAAEAGKGGSLPVQAAQDAHAALRARIDALLAEAEQLRVHQETLGDTLMALGEQLATADRVGA